MKKIKLYRYNDCEKTKRKNWKELISSLVLCGYEVYEVDDYITFTLGYEDSVEEIKQEKSK